MKTWIDATRFHICTKSIPGSWGVNSMSTLGEVLFGHKIAPGISVCGLTENRRMAVIYFQDPKTKRIECSKHYAPKGMRFDPPGRVLAARSSGIDLTRAEVVKLFEDFVTPKAK